MTTKPEGGGGGKGLCGPTPKKNTFFLFAASLSEVIFFNKWKFSIAIR